MAGNGAKRRAVRSRFAHHVVTHLKLDLFARQAADLLAKKIRIPRSQPPGVVISLPANHDAVKFLQLPGHLFTRGDSAIDTNRQMLEVLLQAMHQFIAQRRHFPVFFRAQAFEPGVAGMNNERVAAGFTDGADKVAHKFIALGLVDSNPVLDRDGHTHHIDHRLDAVRHQLRLVH